MILKKEVALAALVAGLAADAARAGEAERFYIAAGGTVAILGDADQAVSDAPFPGSTLTIVNHNDTGWGGYAALGWRVLNPVRVEAEFGRTENDSDSFDIVSPFAASLDQAGETDVWRFMANAYYDFGGPGARLRPYIGAGVGAAKVEWYRFAGTALAPNSPFVHIDDSATQFAWQAMGGAALQVGPRLSVTAQYRWFDAGTVDHATEVGQAVSSDVDGHHVDIGLRFSF